MDSPFSLNDKTIVVTGASSGIGRSVAISCSQAGARVIAMGRNKDRLNETLSMMHASDHKAVALELTDTATTDEFISSVDKIDGIVNVAGIVHSQPVKFLKEESLREIMDVNFMAPVLFTQKLYKKKKLNKGASIIFISSISGPEVTYVGNASYSASKSALTGIAKTMALELGPRGIRVNCILPAMIQTELLSDIDASSEDLAEDMKKYPMGGYGEPEDVANSVIFLLSQASKWMTGTNLKLDGGLTLR